MRKPLSFTEEEFRDSLLKDGFLSERLEEARPHFTHLHNHWFDHAYSLNRAGLQAFYAREDAVVGLTSQDPISVATRLTMRAFNAFQGAIILYERGLSAEGDTLARGVFEIAFWIGLLSSDADLAVACFRNEEIKSQRGRAKFYKKQLDEGSIKLDAGLRAQFLRNLGELEENYDKTKNLGLEEVADKAGLTSHFDAYKHLSASSAHASLHSIHRYLKPNGDGSYDGHVWGPDTEKLDENVALACVGFGLSIALYCNMISVDNPENELKDLLVRTDELRKTEMQNGKHVNTLA